MRRRTLIRSLVSWVCLKSARLWSQPSLFPAKHEATLKELAATVLPESLGRSGTDAIAVQFVRWVQEYRAGAEMQSGYGFTRLRYKPGSPAERYMDQLDQLASGALAQNTMASRRSKIAETLRSANIKDLGYFPDGSHIASDLMTFYFQSSEANDRAYMAEVGKDKCRGLKDSAPEPSPLRNRGGSATV